MKTIRLLGIFITAIFFLVSCDTKEADVENDKLSFSQRVARTILYPFRSGEPFFFSKKAKLAKYLYNNVYGKSPTRVAEALEEGADPNYCRGEFGWIDSNPLNVVTKGFYDTYYKRQRGTEIPNPEPDVEVLRLLLEAGANIQKRPYVWSRVYHWTNRTIEDIRREKKYDGSDYTEAEKVVHIQNFVDDANRILKAFLEAGADPDMLGHPYPYDWEKTKGRIADEEANEYFQNGSRALNVAIEKGIVWESQVDLLLEYTQLDEESLKAAERSNDPEMIEKINKLWAEKK